MTKHDWPPETKRRAEAALSDLEAFWDRFRASTRYGRRLEQPKLRGVRQAIASLIPEDHYGLEILDRIHDVCLGLSRPGPLSEFDEQRILALGLGDVSNMREWMAQLGLIEDSVPASHPS